VSCGEGVSECAHEAEETVFGGLWVGIVVSGRVPDLLRVLLDKKLGKERDNEQSRWRGQGFLESRQRRTRV